MIRKLYAPDKGGESGAAVSDKTEEIKEAKPTDFKSFAEVFSAKRNASVEDGGDPEGEGTQQKKESMVEGDKKQEEQKKEFFKKKPGSNIPQLVEDKKKAEKERDELKAKVEEFETKTKVTFEKQISDLQAKIDSGDFSAKKEQEFQEKINKLESSLTEKEQSFVNEKKQLQDRLSFYDLSENEDFQREYFRPVQESHLRAVELIGGDKKKQETFQRALVANSIALRSTDKDERLQAESERDSLISSIVEDMDTFKQGRFIQAAESYIEGSKKHAVALINHVKTAEEIRKRANEVRDKAIAERYGIWNSTYEKMGTEYKEDELSDDDIKSAKELGIDIEEEVRASEHLAKQTIAGKSEITGAIGIIHAGRTRPFLKAKIAILENELKERDALIEKLRGDSTKEGDSSSTAQATKEGKSFDGFLNKFRPGKK